MGPKHQKARAANLEKVWYSLTIYYLSLNNSYDMKKSLILALLVLGALSLKAQAVIGPEHQERAAALVQQMTLDEKISLIAGYQDGFHTAPVERLGIPEIRMADGPQGVRNNTKSTLFACGVAAAASWNPSLVRKRPSPTSKAYSRRA